MSYLHSCNVLHGNLHGNNVCLSSSTKDVRRWVARVRVLGVLRTLRMELLCTLRHAAAVPLRCPMPCLL